MILIELTKYKCALFVFNENNLRSFSTVFFECFEIIFRYARFDEISLVGLRW